MTKPKYKKEKNKNDQIYKDYVLKKVGLSVQFTLLFLLVLFGIITIFQPGFKIACFITMGLALLVIAYNNHKIYKRKALTIPYIIGALLSFLSCV